MAPRSRVQEVKLLEDIQKTLGNLDTRMADLERRLGEQEGDIVEKLESIANARQQNHEENAAALKQILEGVKYYHSDSEHFQLFLVSCTSAFNQLREVIEERLPLDTSEAPPPLRVLEDRLSIPWQGDDEREKAA